MQINSGTEHRDLYIYLLFFLFLEQKNNVLDCFKLFSLIN